MPQSPAVLIIPAYPTQPEANLRSHAPLYPLKIGIKLNYVPANTVTIITGWQSINPQSTYHLYNANGLDAYGYEIQFAYDLIRKNKILN